MSRMNNTARSLQIISRQNGWDPNQIEGGGRIDEILHAREHPNDSDTWAIPAVAADPQNNHPGSEKATYNMPTQREEQSHRVANADPFPGMPGAAE